MAKRGYSDGAAWIQRRRGVDTETAKRGYSDGVPWNFSKSDHRRYSIPVAIEMSSCRYSDDLDI